MRPRPGPVHSNYVYSIPLSNQAPTQLDTLSSQVLCPHLCMNHGNLRSHQVYLESRSRPWEISPLGVIRRRLPSSLSTERDGGSEIILSLCLMTPQRLGAAGGKSVLPLGT